MKATWTQGLPDWIAAHVRMYEDFGGVPALTVPDNLKASVQHASFYEPELNPTYQDLAAHYGSTVLPTRTAQPGDGWRRSHKVTSGRAAASEFWATLPHPRRSASQQVPQASVRQNPNADSHNGKPDT